MHIYLGENIDKCGVIIDVQDFSLRVFIAEDSQYNIMQCSVCLRCSVTRDTFDEWTAICSNQAQSKQKPGRNTVYISPMYVSFAQVCDVNPCTEFKEKLIVD